MDITETSPHRMFAAPSGSRHPGAASCTSASENIAVPNHVNERSRSTLTAPERVREADAYRREFQHALSCIAPDMERVEAKIRCELSSSDPLIAEMLRYVAGLGGKRLRPALALLTADWLGVVTDETVRLGVVVELVHTATLVHDDILDHATLRRHKPTLHVRWDVPSSVLVGDWLFTHAYRLANDGESTLPGRWIALAAQRVCEGEIRQGSSVANWNLSESDYLRMLEDKTGALCGVSCGLGAWSAGASLDICQELDHFGIQLGTAFQIFDDWLDLWGDAQRSGKTLGTDLSQWKPTLPVLRTLSSMQPSDRSAWIATMEHGSADAGTWLRAKIEQCDASEYTLQRARSIISDATDRLRAVATSHGGTDHPAFQSLIRLAHASIARGG